MQSFLSVVNVCPAFSESEFILPATKYTLGVLI